MKKNHFLLAGFLSLLVVAAMPEAWAWGVNYRTLPGKPSKLTQGALSNAAYVFACVNVDTGDLLDCPFTLKITELAPPVDDLDNNGGHAHSNPGRSLGDLFSVPNGAKAQVKSGSTANGWAAVAHELPEFSGKIITVADVKVPILPSGYWRCVDGYGGYRCLDNQTWRTETTTDVRVPGLESLPGASGVPILNPDGTTAPYTKVRSADTNHLDANAYYAVPTTNVALVEMARIYKKQTKSTLSVNDMSLPKGGKFDVNGSWSGAHGEHRLGLSADINRDGINCLDDDNLEKAVDAVIPAEGPRYVSTNVKGRSLSRLLCETGGRKHIDFDGIPIIAR